MVIRCFSDRDTEPLFHSGQTQHGAAIANVASRKLDMLDAATELADLQEPPGNRLERLSGDRLGQHSIRINGQWRLCFVWTPAGPEAVEMVDYH